MPGELGKCPKCKKEISLSAQTCRHCGETKFFGTIVDKDDPVILCPDCRGIGECEKEAGEGSGTYFYWAECECRGTGTREVLQGIDLRTGKMTGQKTIGGPCPRPASWGPKPIREHSTSSGCLVIIGAFLTLASVLLIAVLF